VTDSLPDSGDRRRLLPAFLPYLVLSAVHLVLLSTGPAWAVTATKALLMPLLALAVVMVARPLRGRTIGLLLLAIALSWGGDVALSFPGQLLFVVGLCLFLLGHVAYIVPFLRLRPRGRRLPVWTLVYVAWYAAFLALLGPDLGVLFVPVAIYGLVLGAMAALAGGIGGVIALGGALFVVSDSVLALGRFLPGYEFALHDLTVMSTYLAAQGLIALGVVRLSAPAPSSPAPGRPASATAR